MTGPLPPWRDVLLERTHNRARFDCGTPTLNEYLARYARQDQDRGISRTYVALDEGDGRTIHGFYSLSPAQIEQSRASQAIRSRAGRYPIGGYRLGRLAVSRSVQGSGLGAQLLVAAAARCIRAAEQVGGQVMVIDAKDERAASWYQRFGAEPLLDAPLTLLMPYALFSAAITQAGQSTS